MSEAAQPFPRLLRPQSDADGASQHPGFVRPSAPLRRDPRPRGRGEGEWVPLAHLGRRRSLMAAGEGERRGAAPRRQRTDGVVFRRPPRPPPRAWALVAARVEAAGAEYPSDRPVPPRLPASPPRPPMSQAPWYRPPAAAQWRGRRWPRSPTTPPPGRGVSGEGENRRGTSRTPCRCPRHRPVQKQTGTSCKIQAGFEYIKLLER